VSTRVHGTYRDRLRASARVKRGENSSDVKHSRMPFWSKSAGKPGATSPRFQSAAKPSMLGLEGPLTSSNEKSR
jgi:hypothetical protein